MPTEQALRKYYARFYEKWEEPDSSQKITFDAPRRLAQHISRHVTAKGERLRILDFGGGDGTISRCIAQDLIDLGRFKCASITLVEWCDECPNGTDRILFQVHERIPDDHHFQIVLASAILEHIPAPREIMRSLLSSIATDGLFYARTPYLIPLIRLAPFAATKLFRFPGHVHDMGQDFWESVLGIVPTPYPLCVAVSRPSIVEADWRKHFAQWAISVALKAPWYLLGRNYGLVGGWEVVIKPGRPMAEA